MIACQAVVNGTEVYTVTENTYEACLVKLGNILAHVRARPQQYGDGTMDVRYRFWYVLPPSEQGPHHEAT